jgi:hypothetical protein
MAYNTACGDLTFTPLFVIQELVTRARARETTGRWYPTTRGSQVVHFRLASALECDPGRVIVVCAKRQVTAGTGVVACTLSTQYVL